jgi:PAS domain S-box-containing protein
MATSATSLSEDKQRPWPLEVQALQQALNTQRNYNHLITTIISCFVDISPADLDQEIHHALHLVHQATQVDSCYLSFCKFHPTVPDHTWAVGFLDPDRISSLIHLPWSCTRLKQEELVCIADVATLPEAATQEQIQWQQHGIGAVLILPLVHKSAVVGAMGLVTRQPVDAWSVETIQLMQVLGKMIVATQKRLEDERLLQENEERLRLALSATNQGLYDVDLTTGEVLVSPEYATMLGYDPATFHETEDHWREMLHPDDWELTTAIYDAYVAGEIPEYTLEFRLKTQSGQWKWILSLGKIVAWDEAGRPLRMLGTHTDIDALKRAEHALRASEIQFRTFMDNSPMVAWINDPDTHQVEYTSRGWFRNYAPPPQSIDLSPQGKSLFEIFPEEIAQVYAHHNRWVVEHNESLEVVEPGIRPDYSSGEFLTFKFPLPQPHGKTLVGGVAIDITERNWTEQRLALQSTILARIARKEPLHEILMALTLAIEDLLREGLCSIMFCGADGCLHVGVAPHLPVAYGEALEGTQVGEAMGSCGTAAVRRQPVIVEDIATDPLWANFRDLPLAHGLRSCWSIPIFASDGPVLATLAVYHREPRQPYAHDLDTLQLAANLAKVAIEQDQATHALEQLNHDLEDRVAQRTEALQRSQDRLKEAQQVARLGWWEMDLQTRQITWSEEVTALLGHAPGNPCTDLRNHLSEAGWDHFNSIVNQAIETGSPCTADLDITRHDGSQGCLFIKATSNRSEQGDHSRIFGIAMDVSERWVIQKILKRSEERSRATLLAMPDLVFRVNREGIYLDFMASPQGVNLVDPQQSLGKHLSEALPPGTCQDHLAQKLTAIHQALTTQTVQCYEQVVAFEGEQRYEEVRVAPCGRDEVVFFIRDISDRKRTELELIRSRDLREAIFNESTDALFLVDPQTGRTLDCNKRAVDLFGASTKHQLVNIEGYRLQVIPFTEAELQDIYVTIDRHGVWSQEIEYRTFTGKTFWGNIATKFITIAGQRLKLVRVTDISDRKQVEMALHHTNQELARATRMKDEFLANMSHELRTPLNAVLGMAEGLQDEVFGPLNERQQKALRTIINSGDHLLELINDILDLAKIEAGQMTLDPTPVAVSYLCSSSLPFVQTQAQEKGLVLEVQVSDHLPDVLVDERRLRQVLINLLNNAVKFTPSGGTVTLSAHFLDAPTAGGTSWLRITVSDTGIGIAPANLDKLFKPFVQIESALNRQYSGTGLGLALVQRMVDLHGGRVQVSSELGLGSQFSVDLPAHAFSPLPAPGTAVQPIPDPSLVMPLADAPKPLLLLVDDNEANRLTLSSYLGAKGYRLEIAKTGREAVSMAQQHHPDLILMDIQMPDMDGLEAAQQIRADPALATTKIVALTALAMPENRDQCLTLGIDTYLSKPVKLKALAATVRTILNNQVPSP